MNEKPIFFRVDFEFVLVGDQETGELTIASIPNRSRYEFVPAQDGEEAAYLDREDGLIIPLSEMRKMASQLPTTQKYDQPHELGDLCTYIENRKQLLRRFLESGAAVRAHDLQQTTPHQIDINSSPEQTTMIAVVYADIVKSTALSRGLAAADYAKLISAFREELLACLPPFHGLPLKTTGDAVIAYFASPSMISKADHSLDCALTMWMVNYNVINPLFQDYGLPCFDVAIALDAGEVTLIPDISGQDIAAHWLNRLKRIQELAKPGGVVLGESLFRILHQGWRERCEEINLPADWPELSDRDLPYKVFEIVS